MSERIIIATIMRPHGDTGVQTHIHTYAQYRAEQGEEIRLLTPFSVSRWLIYPVFAARRLIALLSGTASVWWYRFWHTVFLAKALRRELAHGLPCVVYAQCPLSADAALRMRASCSQRVVMVVHFNISQADEWVGKGLISNAGWLFRAIRQFEADTLPRLDGLVFVSDFMRRQLSQRIPEILSVPYRTVPNFLRDPCSTKAGREQMGDLICIGTLEPRKNQRYALEIIAASRNLGRPLSLTLVGDGPAFDELAALRRELGIEDLVNMTGYVANAADLLSHHQGCLHVASVENLPLTLIEALSRGVPIFASSVGGVPEVFDDCVEGRYIPLDSAEIAASLIVGWLDSTSLMKNARLAARRRYVENFESTVVAAKLTEFICSKRAENAIV